MYGYEVKSLDDRCIKVADESMTTGGLLLLPGANLIDIIPALGKVPAWFPGAYSVRAAAEVKRLTREMIRIPMEQARKRFVSLTGNHAPYPIWQCPPKAEGKAIPSLFTDMLEKKFTDGVSIEEEEAVENIAYTVYGGKHSFNIVVQGGFIIWHWRWWSLRCFRHSKLK